MWWGSGLCPQIEEAFFPNPKDWTLGDIHKPLHAIGVRDLTWSFTNRLSTAPSSQAKWDKVQACAALRAAFGPPCPAVHNGPGPCPLACFTRIRHFLLRGRPPASPFSFAVFCGGDPSEAHSARPPTCGSLGKY